MIIVFIPEENTPDLINASNQYTDIWTQQGEAITNIIERATCLRFYDNKIEALVYEGISQSHPLKLRASYDLDTKKATLIHELLHRICADYKLRLPAKDQPLSVALHMQIDLLLYDLWTELYGHKFATSQVKIESARTAIYKEAWDWALSFPKHVRQHKFALLGD